MPAVGVWIRPEIYIHSPAKPHVIDERKRLCSEIVNTPPEVGIVVFPDQAIGQRYAMSLAAGEVEESCGAIFGESGSEARLFCPAIIVAVAYRTAVDKDRYYTAVIYNLTAMDAAAHRGSMALTIGQTVPLELLHLSMFPIGGIVAE